MVGTAGVTPIETSVALVTVSTVLPAMDPMVALTVVDPVATDVARPLLPAELLTAATDGAVELHVTCVVRSWTVLSVNTPVAVNCWLLPRAMDGTAGDTPMDTSAALVTVSTVP